MKVLIVDDDRSLCQALGELLAAAGYGVGCAHSAGEARARLAGGAFDLVVSDWDMPGSGATVVSYVRRFHPGVPVIILSGCPAADGVVRDGRPVVARLEKPVAAGDLLAAIRDAGDDAVLRQASTAGD
jgi:two-component system, response regulator FlrC